MKYIRVRSLNEKVQKEAEQYYKKGLFGLGDAVRCVLKMIEEEPVYEFDCPPDQNPGFCAEGGVNCLECWKDYVARHY